MEEYPDRAVSWFGVACYYLCIGRYENARRYFGKATTVDASFAPAWLGFGHAFAAQDESDQVRQHSTPSVNTLYMIVTLSTHALPAERQGTSCRRPVN